VHQDERPPGTLISVDGDALRLLAEGEVEVKGRMPWSSNGTFLAEVARDGVSLLAVYKPGRGERPLWDFPRGLYRREAAAWELSELLGWGLVPETVVRDGPLGEGSLQRFVEADFEEHYFTLYDRGELHDALRTICTFDLLANNTDRKSGHCLLVRDPDGDASRDRVWAIDNGLCFAADFKLRTVIWEFAGEPLSRAQLAAVAALADCVPGDVAELISPEEVEAMQRRARWLAVHKVLPGDDSGHRYPWPLV
jgi:uncharacterized repeat protein (TIGR03843 family)